ncbi:hypothetical protein LIER_00405 [Lithospermum erythrorhizon]|uniref:Endoplasmic reticulum vesicle transporter C-terminal domain-containing protein n=1 Tax=Lithospermum erythrorhizon TaxID=34254 RepID=A0AAV3NID1_LITER
MSQRLTFRFDRFALRAFNHSINTNYNCEEVSEAYRKKGWGLSNPDSVDQCKRECFLQRIKEEEEEGEGCNIYGFLDVNKVAGN